MLSAPPFPWHGGVFSRFGDALSQGRLGHAVLLTGPPGVGKSALANAMVSALLCRERTNGAHSVFPCGVCDACVQCAEGHHPDVHPVESDEKTGSIGVTSVRDVCAQLHLTSQMTGYRIGVFADVDRCTVNAANSLLKTLEEPPAGVFMLLLSARPGRLPATILSRCQVWRCALPDAVQASNWLRDQGVEDPEAALERSGGAPLIALSGAAGELEARLQETLQALLAGQLSVVQAARRMEPDGAEATLAGCVRLLDQVLADGAHTFSSGLQIACFGVHRSARQLFAWRDVAVTEFARDRTGLNELATLERVFAAGRGEAPAAICS